MSTRPELHTIFPKRKFINRQLFDLDSRLSYRRLYPVYELLYNGSEEVPLYVNGSDLLIMKKALEKYRSYTRSIDPNLVYLENILVEKAAEHGNNDAIALLAFETLLTKDESTLNPGDKQYAIGLIKQLYSIDHPLSVKLLGDLALKHKDYATAKKYFQEFLLLENDTVLSGEVYKQLGIINFVYEGNLHDAKGHFLQSIKFAPLNKTLESHYFLGEMFLATHPDLARYHLQMAASKSFRSAFKSLGYLELNYFNNYVSAREWFKMGVEVNDYQCLFGLFDCFAKFDKNREAYKTWLLMKSVYEQMGSASVLDEFRLEREDVILRLEQEFGDLKFPQQVPSQEIVA